jgi:hypothetical protein
MRRVCLRENSDLLSAALELIATRHRVIDGKGSNERAPNAEGRVGGCHPPVLLHAGKSGLAEIDILAKIL